MHPLEIRAIRRWRRRPGHQGLRPRFPTGQLSREEIEKGEKDAGYRLKLGESKVILPPAAKKKGPALTRRCRAATSGRARSCGWCAIIPS